MNNNIKKLLLNYYQLSGQVVATVKDLYTSLSNSGVRIAPDLKRVSRSLLLSLYRDITLKSDEEHIQFCIDKMTALLTRLQRPGFSIGDLSNALKQHNIYIVLSICRCHHSKIQ